jgi:hypothetical protein
MSVMKYRNWIVWGVFILLASQARMVWADFGCRFVVQKRQSVKLDMKGKKASFRVTCREDMDLLAVSLYCEKSKNPPSYLVEVFEDRKGLPGPESIGKGRVTPRGGDWFTVPMDHVALSAGKAYHLVVEQDENRGGMHPVGVIGPDNYASIAFTTPRNGFFPCDEAADSHGAVLIWEKDGWVEEHFQPLYALHGGGEYVEGNPYDDFGQRPIHGNGTPDVANDDVLQGEALHPKCGIRPKSFAVRIRKEGNPTSPLYYKVYNNDFMRHVTTFSFSGLALQPSQVTVDFQWVTIGISEGVTNNFQAQCTYVGFQTDSGKAALGPAGCTDCYILSDVGNKGNLPGAAEMTFDGGPHLSREAYSLDGGATWLDEFERDAHVVILGESCPPAEPLGTSSIPTPGPLLQRFEP